jgi:peptidoglycan/xylan/chitin deacetylase (PgdA/CDA1 family)
MTSIGTAGAFTACMQTPNLVTVDVDTPRAASSTDHHAIIDGLLDALDRSKTAATFFVTGQMAESDGAAARRITEAGHEVACLTMTAPAKCRPYAREFSGELQRARASIEAATGKRVRGHRNAAFAVDYAIEWAYDVLVAEGFEYDSSRIPPRHVHFGEQPVPSTIHAVRRWAGTLLEIPVVSSDLLSMRLRLGSTGTVRGIPLPVWRALAEARGEPIVMHLRCSELRKQSLFSRGSELPDKKTLSRVSGLVERLPFTSVGNALPALLRAAPTIES